MIHLYCGDGKGKTTAAVGLAVRCAGCGKKVMMFQFLKDNSSSERNILKNFITLIDGLSFEKPPWELNGGEIRELSFKYEDKLREIAKSAADYDMIILDEAMAAVNFGYISLESVMNFIKTTDAEIVLTGRDPKPEFIEIADYVSEIKSVKHPFTKGITARKGIEF